MITYSFHGQKIYFTTFYLVSIVTTISGEQRGKPETISYTGSCLNLIRRKVTFPFDIPPSNNTPVGHKETTMFELRISDKTARVSPMNAMQIAQ
jgi:hypothetical protein